MPLTQQRHRKKFNGRAFADNDLLYVFDQWLYKPSDFFHGVYPLPLVSLIRKLLIAICGPESNHEVYSILRHCAVAKMAYYHYFTCKSVGPRSGIISIGSNGHRLIPK